MLRNKILFFIFLAGLIFANPQHTYAQSATGEDFQPVFGTVVTDKVNIRSGPGLNFELLGELNQDDEVAVIKEEYGWCKIQLPGWASSFVHKDYIDEGVVVGDKLRVRAGQGTNFNVLGILREGQSVLVLKQQGDWLRIVPPENCWGWIKKDYIELSQKGFTPVVVKPIPAVQKQPKLIEALGKIDDLGKIFNRAGTHKLINGRKILYHLKSEDIDLNNFIYQKVFVVGELIKVENSPYSLINVREVKLKR